MTIPLSPQALSTDLRVSQRRPDITPKGKGKNGITLLTLLTSRDPMAICHNCEEMPDCRCERWEP